MTKIVFDLGATNTRVARVADGAIGEVLKVLTPENRDGWPAHLLGLINQVSGEGAEEIVGGVAGIREREALAGAFPGARIYNDALMSGLGEAIYGAGKNEEVVGYIGLGTGIGTSRISGKKVGTMGFEAGHHIVDFIKQESWEKQVSGRV
ncbi:MAG: hypothetical protein WD896_01030 [Parcubacteria group bacterium]